MRIVSYNILKGGEGRADPLCEVILAQRPDIVALVEANCADVLERISHRLDMDYVVAEGNKNASALLSRWPIVESINHALLRPGLSRSLLEAVVQEPSGRQWVVGVLHLHPHASEADEQARERELEVVLDVFARHRKAQTPHLLAGDFNANSPVQRIDPAALKPESRSEWDANGGRIPRRVVQRLLDAGYVDTLAAARPEDAATVGSFSTQHPGQRVDYIFAWGTDPAQIKDAWVERDRLARYASDHFPVAAEIL